MKNINLFGILIDNVLMAEAIDMISISIEKKEKKKLYFVNADCFNKMYKDYEYYKIVKKGDFIFGDGSGIKTACKITKQKIIDNVNGTDLMPKLAQMCLEKGYSLFLLGGKPGIAEKMSENLKNDYQGIRIAGTHHGYFDKKTENGKITAMINGSKADILLVAFGAPYQEIWIAENASSLNCCVSAGVGGLFDFFSGTMPRAPRWMRALGIEWVFRLIKEPKRMWRRYILGNPLFVFRVYKWNFSDRREIHD